MGYSNVTLICHAVKVWILMLQSCNDPLRNCELKQHKN